MNVDNHPLVHVQNAMVSASRPVMVALRKLDRLLIVMSIRLESRWTPSSVIRFYGAWSHMWDPGDFSATKVVTESIKTQFQFYEVALGFGPWESLSRSEGSTPRCRCINNGYMGARGYTTR